MITASRTPYPLQYSAGGDDSLTDRLVIRGKITGHSLVQINNFGGAGARTDKGILIIEAQPVITRRRTPSA
ncbi:autotransporter outer membrane beta-barrel domain-containing protein [Sodalis ligni]|uniref:autotransporter outer membrane beta-barrel domain-containing protein n=1 Tax=Sodalis ligni TaxID=2697027 RepID=UPI001BDEAB18|nr:autotransporter outer membrane beta-barrel domain-containing protein [Sodalis ligni]